MNLFGPSDLPLVEGILAGLREPVWVSEPVFSPRQARDEDVRALALEHEERAAFGRDITTEADILPGN